MTQLARWIVSTVVTGLCLLAPAAHAASFDCARAGTPTEKAICADPTVSNMDSEMAAAFKTALAHWPAGSWATFIRREQRDWLKSRNENCKADVACLKRDYELRLNFLRKPELKYLGRYVAGTCPHKGEYLDVTPNFPGDGVGVELYICPNPKGNMLLQASGKVDANGELKYVDAGCTRTLRLEQDTVTLVSAEGRNCAMGTNSRVFKRNPAKSPYEAE
jgi:uncharacterized protein YecT (DUF1311 family)